MMDQRYLLFILLLISGTVRPVNGQDICLISVGADTTRFIAFNAAEEDWITRSSFVTLSNELPGIIPELILAGDFTGNGLEEIALLRKVTIEPNMNPDYTCSSVILFKPSGNDLRPAGTWFTALDSLFDFDYVNHVVAEDYNLDGRDDIAVFYNNPYADEQPVFVFESNGKGFNDPVIYFETVRNEFNFSTLKHVLPGDFNRNGLQDLAVFYDYFGDIPGTPQRIFLFESDGNGFSLLPAFFSTTKGDFDFDLIKAAVTDDFDRDGIQDIAVFYDDTLKDKHSIRVFMGGESGFTGPDTWFEADNSMNDPGELQQLVAGRFDTDTLPDLAAFFSRKISGIREILLYPGGTNHFADPVPVLSGTGLYPDFPSTALSGRFIKGSMIRPATWKNNRKGAISFTFDDGAYGAFVYGAAALEQAGVTGTFYIFTDTTKVYDAPLAGTSVIATFREKGFEIASHTMNHANLGILTGEGLTDSVRSLLQQSKQELDERYHQNTLTMSIPFGSFRFETMDLIEETFLSARSSEYGYNLSTPENFYALKSFPVLSTTTVDMVMRRVSKTEEFGYYLPLMYHDISAVIFNPDSAVYSYYLPDFRKTVDSVLQRDVWVDTHENIYKYIRERDGLTVNMLGEDEDRFEFFADDGLPDSLFNVELTLMISLPVTWNDPYVTVGMDGDLTLLEVDGSSGSPLVTFNLVPDGSAVEVWEGIYSGMEPGATVESQEKVINLFPIPACNVIHVKTDMGSGQLKKIMIFNSTGSCVRSMWMEGEELTIPVARLPEGIYILRLESGENIRSRKFIISR